MQLVKVSEKKIETVKCGADVGLYVNNLGTKVALSVVVKGQGGFIAVEPSLIDLQEQFDHYDATKPIHIYLTGGRNTQVNREYIAVLIEYLNELHGQWVGDWNLENHANEDIHLDGLTLLGVNIDSN